MSSITPAPITSIQTVTGNVLGSVGSVVGNVGGNVLGSVANVLGSVGSVLGGVGGSVVGSVASVLGNVLGSVASVVDKTGFAPPVGDVKRAFLEQASPVQNTWYTILSLAATNKGFLEEVRVARDDTTGFNCEIRVTIDGGTAQTFVMSEDSVDAFGYAGGQWGLYALCHARFETSLLVEIRVDIAAVANLEGRAIYIQE